MKTKEILRDEGINTNEFYSNLFDMKSISKQNIEFPTTVVLYLL